MRVLVIGGNAAGLSAASAIRKAHDDWEIEVYEQGSYFSYGACGIPYFVKGEIPTVDNLITLTKDTLINTRKLAVFDHHKVIKVDFFFPNA